MRFAFVLFALVISLAPASAAPADLVLDTATNPLNGTNGGEVGIAGVTPDYYIGDAYTLVPGTTDITGIDLFVVNESGQTFTDVLANIYIWGSVNTGAATPSNPVFGDELAEESVTLIGTLPSGYYYGLYTGNGVQPGASPGFTFSSPVVIPSNTIGVTLNFQGSTNYGASFNNTQGLTSLLSDDAPASRPSSGGSWAIGSLRYSRMMRRRPPGRSSTTDIMMPWMVKQMATLTPHPTFKPTRHIRTPAPGSGCTAM